MSVSLKDIARATGISICSVSQILNNRPSAQLLREETRQRVRETAKRLGYNRNELAATIAKGKSRILAFVMSDMGAVDYTGRIVNGVLAEAAERNYAVIVYRLGQMTEEEIIGHVLGWRAAGVLLHIDRRSRAPKLIERLKQEKLPYGLVDLSNPDGIGVTTDNFDGIAQAVGAMVENGRKRLAYVSSFTPFKRDDSNDFHYQRIDGFWRALDAHSLRSTGMALQLDSPDVGKRKANIVENLRTLQRANVDGLVCESDYVAMEFMAAMLEAGMDLPKDCAVIGYGDVFMAQLAFPPLASIAQDYEQIGGLTTRLVIEAIENKQAQDPTNIILPVRLIPRQSLG